MARLNQLIHNTFARPVEALGRAVPAFARLLSTGAGEAVALRPLSDGEVVWLLSLLAQTVRNAGAALLPHLPLLRSLVCAAEERAAAGGGRKVGKAAYKLRRRLLGALLATFPADLRSLPPRLRPAAAARPWEAWGWLPPLHPPEAFGEAMEMEWHSPSPAEVAAAAEMCFASLERAEKLAAEVVAGGADAVPEPRLRRALLELRAVGKGALPHLADDGAAAPGGAPAGGRAEAPHGASPEPCGRRAPVGACLAELPEADAAFAGLPPLRQAIGISPEISRDRARSAEITAAAEAGAARERARVDARRARAAGGGGVRARRGARRERGRPQFAAALIS